MDDVRSCGGSWGQVSTFDIRKLNVKSEDLIPLSSFILTDDIFF